MTTPTELIGELQGDPAPVRPLVEARARGPEGDLSSLIEAQPRPARRQDEAAPESGVGVLRPSGEVVAPRLVA